MEAYDEEAENQANAEYGSDSDAYAELDEFVRHPKIISEKGGPVDSHLFSQVEADIHDEKDVAHTNDRSRISKAQTCAKPKNCDTHDCKSKINPKNSSDEECACGAPQLNANEKKKIIEIQKERKKDAEEAKKKAEELRKKAEAAIKAANEARLAAVTKSVELSSKAK